MEKIFSNKRIVLIAFFTVFSTTAVLPDADPGDHSVPVELRFVRWVKNQPIFELDFAGNPRNDEFKIVVKDERDEILYTQNIKGENFSKSFLLNTDEIGNESLMFEIVSKKLNVVRQFRVNRHTFLKEETA
ncbi:MAG TPA: hypothetical protein VFP87_00555 [Chitinophagaceae bacterium]|nr:hypothetical protein [Chitinophagaceae bacterium]